MLQTGLMASEELPGVSAPQGVRCNDMRRHACHCYRAYASGVPDVTFLGSDLKEFPVELRATLLRKAHAQNLFNRKAVLNFPP